MMHQYGTVLPDRGDGLNWLKCTQCGREWAEKDSGAFAKGSRTCTVKTARVNGANRTR